jgi:hypothetical protein
MEAVQEVQVIVKVIMNPTRNRYLRQLKMGLESLLLQRLRSIQSLIMVRKRLIVMVVEEVVI